MKRKLNNLILLAAILTVSVVAALAQEQAAEPVDEGDIATRQPNARRNLMQTLGLTPEQVAQIMGIQKERRPQMEAAQERLRGAVQNLDRVIYADTFLEGDYQSRLREYHSAREDVARIRFNSELAIRKILTPEQLVAFRGLRRKFSETRENRQTRRRGQKGTRPLRRGIRVNR